MIAIKLRSTPQESDLRQKLTMGSTHTRAVFLSFSACSLIACGEGDPPVGPSGPEPRLTLEVRYLSPITPQRQSVFAAAVDKWTSALFKDLGDFRLDSPANQCFSGAPRLDETHHNPLVFVSIAHMDGAGGEVGYSQVCALSARDGLPIVSHIRVDLADIDSLEARGVLPRLFAHELGHSLGFSPGVYLPKNLTGGGTNDPYFSGVSARAEFAKTGSWYTGVTVPLEDVWGIGPNDAHWRFSVFGDELMAGGWSGDLNVQLSTITLGLFKDIGYEVDFSVADPYEVRPPSAPSQSIPEFILVNDVRTISTPIVLSPVVRE